MKNSITRLMAVMALGLFLSLVYHDTAYGQNVQQNVAQRSKEEIIKTFQRYLPLDKNDRYMESNDVFEKIPAYTAPYEAGKLKKEYILDGIAAVNWARYLAGVPDDILPDWSLEGQEQASALINALNNSLSHTPSQPAGMNQALYQLGYAGSKSSNIAYGTPTLYTSVMEMYMPDSDNRNIDRVGHRRWIINPQMTTTMFGFTFRGTENLLPFSSMYAFDRSRAASEVTYDYISWPSAGHFPSEVFMTNHPWSVSLNTEKYDNKRTSNIRVSLVRASDGQTWHFDKQDKDKEGKYFNVETSNFGIPFCIIFRPDMIANFTEDDRFKVEITGLYTKSGQETSISYETVFFNMIPQSTLRGENIKLTIGEQLQLFHSVGKLSPGSGTEFLKPEFSSTNPAVASVDANGNVTAKSAGTVSIRLSNYFVTYRFVHIHVREDNGTEQVSSWAKSYYNKAKSNGIIDINYDNNYQNPIDRRIFATAALKVYENILGKQSGEISTPFKDIDSRDISYSYHLGLIKGTSENTFSPGSTITRQEAATLLLNIYNKVMSGQSSDSLPVPGSSVTFLDDAKISPWAKDNVYKAVHLGLISGVGDNKFDPSGNMTREQAYVCLQKLQELLDQAFNAITS